MVKSSFTVESDEYFFSLDEDVLKVWNKEETVRDEFDITTVAHIQCITSHEDHRIIGLFLLFVGAVVLTLGLKLPEYSFLMIVGLIIMLIGVIVASHKKDETTFQVTIQGINESFKYKISEKPTGINDLIEMLNEKRAELRRK